MMKFYRFYNTFTKYTYTCKYMVHFLCMCFAEISILIFRRLVFRKTKWNIKLNGMYTERRIDDSSPHASYCLVSSCSLTKTQTVFVVAKPANHMNHPYTISHIKQLVFAYEIGCSLRWRYFLWCFLPRDWTKHQIFAVFIRTFAFTFNYNTKNDSKNWTLQTSEFGNKRKRRMFPREQHQFFFLSPYGILARITNTKYSSRIET